jgi:diguanylate cyclase (GGDEF)-like protein
MLNRFHTGCVFRVVGKGEELEIGFWYYIVWIPVYIYLLAASVLVLRHLRRDGRLADREEDVLALICLAVLWIGAILDECFLFVPAISMALTICFLVAYLNEQSSIVYMDALTHLNNRRQFNRYLDAKIRERKSSDKNVFLAIVDIDFFKEINDKYGHVEGDSALVHTADCLRACAEEEDGKMLICRYGGDEFALVMEAADHSQVENFCIKVQKMLSETGKNKAYALEISFGIAPLTKDCSGINELLRSADEAMYALNQLHHSRRA